MAFRFELYSLLQSSYQILSIQNICHDQLVPARTLFERGISPLNCYATINLPKSCRSWKYTHSAKFDKRFLWLLWLCVNILQLIVLPQQTSSIGATTRYEIQTFCLAQSRMIDSTSSAAVWISQAQSRPESYLSRNRRTSWFHLCALTPVLQATCQAFWPFSHQRVGIRKVKGPDTVDISLPSTRCIVPPFHCHLARILPFLVYKRHEQWGVAKPWCRSSPFLTHYTVNYSPPFDLNLNSYSTP